MAENIGLLTGDGEDAQLVSIYAGFELGLRVVLEENGMESWK